MSNSSQAEFRVPLFRFVERHLPRSHADHIWAGPLKALYANRHHTPSEWKQLIENLRNQPAHRPN